MPAAFSPRLDVLSPPQRRLWSELTAVRSSFVLYGGTAIAVHLGHRASIDFDFFGTARFDPDRVYGSLPFLRGAEVLQKASDTLTCLVDRQGEVRVSFFGVAGLAAVREPVVSPDNQLPVAALIDLAATKAAVIQKRAQAKDYIDLDAILSRGISLSATLAAAKHIYGRAFNPQITLKALTYFADGDLPSLPVDIRLRLIQVVKSVSLDHLPDLEALRRIPPSGAAR